MHLTSALCALCASLSCFLSCPLPAGIPSLWSGGHISGGLSCPPREPVLVSAEALFSTCLKNCTLFPYSGVLPGCYIGAVRGRSLVSWGGLCLSYTGLAQGAPATAPHFPPVVQLVFFPAPIPVQGWQREMPHGCRGVCGAGAWPAVQ